LRSKEAFLRGKIAKPCGSLWHIFRRVWATERKDLPLKDVAAAGGWRDTSTLLRYQQPDEKRSRQSLSMSGQRAGGWDQHHVAVLTQILTQCRK
jgi:hypothetical protein